MSLIPITIPVPVYPKADPEHPCPCTERPMELEFKTCLLFWLAAPGQAVEKGEIVAEFECEKKTAQIPAPASGVLVQYLADGDTFDPADAIGAIEVS